MSSQLSGWGWVLVLGRHKGVGCVGGHDPSTGFSMCRAVNEEVDRKV